MTKSNLILAFFFALFATVAQTAFFPTLNFMTFAPFIALSIVHLRIDKVLWVAFICGIIIDLLSSTYFGFYSLCYTLTAGFLYRQRRNFIDDKPLNLALFTALISLSSTIVSILLSFIFDRRAAFTGKWAFLDCFSMPILDATYALVCFYCPAILAKALKRQWRIVKLQYKRLKQ